jgi:polyhydroxyalkanoate synthesis regulator phasin
MRKILFILSLAAILAVTFGSSLSLAAEVDILINKLVEKGLLTREEATELISDMQKEGERQKEEIKEVATEAAKEEAKTAAAKIPGWLEKVHFKGDLRLRYQGDERDPDTKNRPHRSRGRIRLRFGIGVDINEQWKAGVRLASGGADARSTNQSFDDFFSTKDWRLDRAYVQYTPIKWAKLIGGKFGNPLYRPKDLLWDSDISPEGAAANLKYKPISNVELYFNPAFFVLDESSSTTQDPTMLAFQGGLKWTFHENMYFKFLPGYYKTRNLEGNAGNAGAHQAFTNNSVDAAGNRIFDYGVWTVPGEVGFTKVSNIVPMVAVFGEYAQSDADDADKVVPTGDDENTAWIAGIKFGHAKVKKWLQWQFKYNYRYLERDAWPDFLPDSDFYGGDTNTKGHEFEFTFGINKNTTLGVDYYRSKQINLPAGVDNPEEDLIQLDLVLKW